MKKGLVVTGILLIAILSAVFLIIPSQLIIVETGSAQCNFNAAKRFVFNDSNWNKWATVTGKEEEPFSTKINNSFFVNTGVALTKGDDLYQTNLILIPFNIDSTGVEWRDTILTGNNPFTRIARYNAAKNLKKKMEAVLGNMINFLSSKKNVYGTEVFKIQETDRPLLSKRIVLNREPNAQDAYDLITLLRNYARKQGDPGNGQAMKYSSKMDSVSYELMVAIPTEKFLPAAEGFIPKGLVGGNPIAIDITGGEGSIRNGWKGIQQYKEDYRLSSPAIPFEVMITDRMIERDTTKWKTRIVYPTRL